MELAGRVFDALAERGRGPLEAGEQSRARRLVRAAALLHDIGHAPFSHSAEELFAEGLDHEAMTRRLLHHDEVEAIFERWGRGISTDEVERLLLSPSDPVERLLAEVVSGELDVDKMDYLLRDSLFCGVRYGSYDLERLLDTILPIEDPQTGEWGIGIHEGGVHALEALVMARYYMFTQVYFNLTGKALELHFSRWLQETGRRWPAAPESFLEQDDQTVLAAMRDSDSHHARAVTHREHYPLAYETREHLEPAEKARFEAILPDLERRFGPGRLLVSNSAKDSHRLGHSRVLVRSWDGQLEPMEEASHFIRHLKRIDRYRIYAPTEIRQEVAGEARRLLAERPS